MDAAMHVSGAGTAARGRRAARLLAGAALALAPLPLAAQGVNDFDLRPRATPTPAPPPVVGPVDPDDPSARIRPRAAPTAEPQPATPTLVLPETTPSPQATTRRPAAPTAQPRTAQPRIAPTTGEQSAPLPESVAPATEPGVAAAPTTAQAAPPAAAPYRPRQLDVVSDDKPSLLWALLGGLALLLGIGGWLAWSRHFRHQVRALPAPEVLRPHIAARPQPAQPQAQPAGPAQPEADQPLAIPSAGASGAAAPALGLVLQATRMSATLVNTTLSYRLSVTNNGSEPLHDVSVAGDMIAAHASRPVEDLLGSRGAPLPELHRIAALAPGESVVLGGDIRLPLVSITPIRSGNAALFVPLARLRAHASAASGARVENGGTFLVGQPAAAERGVKNGRLQPFRLDLGPRNYSKLGQQLLSAA